MNFQIFSEINPLRFVITHKPSIEHEYITPRNLKETIITSKGIKDNPDFLLFDDLIHVKEAQKDHLKLYEVLHHFTDGNCFEFTDLFTNNFNIPLIPNLVGLISVISLLPNKIRILRINCLLM